MNPIIISADNNYAPYMSVTMISILKNAKNDTYFDFYLLIPNDFKEEYKNKIKEDVSFYKNQKINFIQMGEKFNETKRMISHISHHAYYRLLAADILPDNYDRAFYLDVDTIIEQDISELFNLDFENNWIMGIKAPGFHFPQDGNKNHCKILEIDNINQYINSGVVMLNLKAIRENNLTPVLIEHSNNNYPCIDQDVINKVFFNHIKHLPLKYNVPVVFCTGAKGKKVLEKTFSKEEIKEAKKHPVIIHYSCKTKPWQNLFLTKALYWWKYAILSKFLFLIIYKNIFKI